MARVTNLKREGGKQHCPGAVVKFEATTEPPNSTGIKWKVDGHVVRTLGNTLRVSGAGGDSKVVTASLENSLFGSLENRWIKSRRAPQARSWPLRDY